MKQYEIFRLDISKYNVQLTFQDDEFESGCVEIGFIKDGKELEGNGLSKTKYQLTRIAKTTSKNKNVIMALIEDSYSGSDEATGTYIIRDGGRISTIIFYNSSTKEYIEVLNDTYGDGYKSLNDYFEFHIEDCSFYSFINVLFKSVNKYEDRYCYYINY